MGRTCISTIIILANTLTIDFHYVQAGGIANYDKNGDDDDDDDDDNNNNNN